jgi:hypothetical protein
MRITKTFSFTIGRHRLTFYTPLLKLCRASVYDEDRERRLEIVASTSIFVVTSLKDVFVSVSLLGFGFSFLYVRRMGKI